MNEKQYQIFIFLTVMFFYGYFVHFVIYDNAATRLDLTCSILLHRTTNIDVYHRNTLDKAYRNGHYYCDKAPGLSLAAAPVLTAVKWFVKPDKLLPDNINLHYLLVLIVIAIPSAIASVMLFKKLLVHISPAPAAAMLTISYALGTMALTYSTLFIDHQFSTALILIGFLTLMPIFNQGSGVGSQESKMHFRTSALPHFRTTLFLCGLLFGWAAISEFPSAVSAAIILIFVFFKLKPRTAILWAVLGGVLPVSILLIYNAASFGNPFSIGYFFESHGYYRAGMSAGLAGVTYPKLLSLLRLLFLPERGLFWGAPFLLFSIPGFAVMLRRRDWQRKIGLLCLLMVCVRLLIVSAYYEPWGGFAPGPRFLIGCLPFLVIPIGALWEQMTKSAKHLLIAFCVFSVFYNTILNAVEPQVPGVVRHPVMEYSLSLLHRGYDPNTIVDFIGVKFPYSFILFFVVVAAMFWGLIRVGVKGKWFSYWRTVAMGIIVLFGCYFAIARLMPTSDRAQVKYYLGVALRQNGKLADAAMELGKAVRGKPDFPEAHYALGITHIKMEKYEEAEKDFREAIRTGMRDARAHISLGALYLMMKKFDSADEVLKDGMEKFPESEELKELSATLKKLQGGKNARKP